jgi:hypothetical protein
MSTRWRQNNTWAPIHPPPHTHTSAFVAPKSQAVPQKLVRDLRYTRLHESSFVISTTFPCHSFYLFLHYSYVIATGWTIGVLGFDSWWGLRIFLTTASRTDLGPTQPPIQWVRRSLSLGVKRPRREADHSPPSSAEVKE